MAEFSPPPAAGLSLTGKRPLADRALAGSRGLPSCSRSPAPLAALRQGGGAGQATMAALTDNMASPPVAMAAPTVNMATPAATMAAPAGL